MGGMGGVGCGGRVANPAFYQSDLSQFTTKMVLGSFLLVPPPPPTPPPQKEKNKFFKFSN